MTGPPPYVEPDREDLAPDDKIISANLYPPPLKHSTRSLPAELNDDDEANAVWSFVTRVNRAKAELPLTSVPGWPEWTVQWKHRKNMATTVGDLSVWAPGVVPKPHLIDSPRDDPLARPAGRGVAAAA